MKLRYKIVKADEAQKDFMKKYKCCVCTYCDYAEGVFCTFRGRKCPAGKEEYLKKIYSSKRKINGIKIII